MSVKINFNQKQEQCLVDLFNHTNAGLLGFSVKETEVSFDKASNSTSGGDRDSQVVMRTNGSTRLRGQTVLRYNRLDMGQMPVDAKSLMITLDSQHRSLQDLAGRLNAILGIQLKPTDIVDEPIVLKSMPYGITKRRITIEEGCLMFKGQFEVSLIREEPLSLSRPPVVFNDVRLVVENEGQYRSLDQWKTKWSDAKKIGAEQSTLKTTKPFLTDRYLVEGDAGVGEVKEDLAFWYQFYPKGK